MYFWKVFIALCLFLWSGLCFWAGRSRSDLPPIFSSSQAAPLPDTTEPDPLHAWKRAARTLIDREIDQAYA